MFKTLVSIIICFVLAPNSIHAGSDLTENNLRRDANERKMQPSTQQPTMDIETIETVARSVLAELDSSLIRPQQGPPTPTHATQQQTAPKETRQQQITRLTQGIQYVRRHPDMTDDEKYIECQLLVTEALKNGIRLSRSFGFIQLYQALEKCDLDYFRFLLDHKVQITSTMLSTVLCSFKHSVEWVEFLLPHVDITKISHRGVTYLEELIDAIDATQTIWDHKKGLLTYFVKDILLKAQLLIKSRIPLKDWRQYLQEKKERFKQLAQKDNAQLYKAKIELCDRIGKTIEASILPIQLQEVGIHGKAHIPTLRELPMLLLSIIYEYIRSKCKSKTHI